MNPIEFELEIRSIRVQLEHQSQLSNAELLRHFIRQFLLIDLSTIDDTEILFQMQTIGSKDVPQRKNGEAQLLRTRGAGDSTVDFKDQQRTPPVLQTGLVEETWIGGEMGEGDVVVRLESFRGDLHHFRRFILLTLAAVGDHRKLILDVIRSKNTRDASLRKALDTHVARLLLFVRPNEE